MSILEESNTPYVSEEIINYLEDVYNAHESVRLAERQVNADRGLGFISGVQEVITNLKGVRSNTLKGEYDK